jgi:WD40 repeat protein
MNPKQAVEFTDQLLFEKTGKRLTDLQRVLLESCCSDKRQSYQEIAISQGYSITYLKQDIGPKLWQLLSNIFEEKVRKNNFRAALERKAKEYQIQEQTKIEPTLIEGENTLNIRQKQISWNTAPDVTYFFGRELELSQLEEWIIKDNCRLVAIVGMGGIGKTYLSIKLAQNIQHNFEYIIWRSLNNAPSLKYLLTDILNFLTQTENDLVVNIDEQISHLINFCRHHRCLIILDNLETILSSGINSGFYQQKFADYSKFLKKLGECSHHSCLLITSREKSKEIVVMDGETLPVRCLNLGGLNIDAALEILKIKGCLWQNPSQANLLVEKYSGNPLALKIVAATIKELFDGYITEFIKNKLFIFDEIIYLLEEHIKRLSDLGKTILFWLALNQKSVSSSELEIDIYPPVSRQSLITALKSLRGRSLIESKDNLFSLQPVIKDYLINKFIQQIVIEITTEELSLFNSYALLKTNVKEYTRKSQVKFIVKPILDKLIIIFKSKNNLENQLQEILKKLQSQSFSETNYAVGNIINLLCQLKRDLTGWNFSNLTIRQAYLQECKLHNVNFANAHFQQCVFAEHLTNILSIAYSPDGQFLATGDVNGEIRLWYLAENRLVSILKGHAGWVYSVAFSPKGTLLVSGSSDQTIKVWDPTTGECLQTLFGHNQRVRSVTFTPDGQKLASSSSDYSIKIWKLETGQCLKTLKDHTSYVWSVVISPNGNLLFSGSEDKTIKAWNLETGQCLQTLKGHTGWIRTLALSPDGKILASGGGDRIIKIWELETGRCIENLNGHTQRIRSLAFSPDGLILASGGGDHTIRLWDWQQGTCLKTLHGHNSRLGAVCFRGDGKILASGGEDSAIKLWEINTGQCIKTWQGYASWVQAVAFSPDGKILASGSEDKSIKLWDLSNLDPNSTTKRHLATLQGHKGWVCSVAFSPDGKLLASASSDYTLKIWDVVTGECQNTLFGHTRWIRSVVFSPNGKFLASASGDYTLKIWDLATGKCLKSLQGHQSWLWSVAFSPDHKLLASGSEDKTIKIWDLDTGKCLKSLQGHGSWVQSVVFSPDGEYLASGSCDQTLKLWHIKTGKCLKTLAGHGSWVQSVVFSPDGDYLASGSCDQTLRIWRVQTGECLKILRGHYSWVWSVSFHPQGKYLASGSQDETIKIWHIDTNECLFTLRSKRPLEDCCFRGVKGLTTAEILTLKSLGADIGNLS